MAELLACEDDAFVRRAYWVLLGREPDPGGLVNYLERLRGGTSKQQVLLELGQSPEGRAKDTSTLRAAPADSVTVPALSTPAGVSSLWSASTWDDLMANHGRAFLSCAYQTLLGREVDPDGLRYYQARLRAGVSKVKVLCALRYSTECRTRTLLLRELRRQLPNGPNTAATAAPAARSPARPAAEFMVPAPALADVLGYDDETLVSALCWLALGAGGEQTQVRRDALARLRGGSSRRQMLREMQRSAPARTRRALMRRLDREIAKYFVARVPLVGRLFAAVFSVDGDSPLEMRVRRIEYRLLGASEEAHRAAELRAVSRAEPSPDSPAAEQPASSAVSPLMAKRGPADGSAAVAVLRSMPAPADWGDE